MLDFVMAKLRNSVFRKNQVEQKSIMAKKSNNPIEEQQGYRLKLK